MKFINIIKKNRDAEIIFSCIPSYKKEFVRFVFLRLILMTSSIITTYLFKVLVDDIMIEFKLDYLKWVCFGYIVVFGFESLIVIYLRKSEIYFYNNLSESIRNDLWRQAINIKASKYKNIEIGDIKNCIENDAAHVGSFIQRQVVDYIVSIITIIVNGIILLYLNWILALFSLLMVPLSFFVTAVLSKKQREVSENYRKLFGKYESWLYRCLSCWRDIKAMVLNSLIIKEFFGYWNNIKSIFIKKSLIGFGNSTLHSFKDFFITKMNLYFIGGIIILRGHFTIGLLITFMNYYDIFFNAIQNLNNIKLELQDSVPSLQRVSKLLNLQNNNSNDIIISKITKIKFNNVCFGYDKFNRVLDNINFEIVDNGYVAIVGESGCGKSTIFKLLLMLEHCDAGNILISGTPINKINSNSLYENISVVTQDAALYNMSIIDNLTLNDEEVTMQQVIQLCKDVGIHDEIVAFPEQYNTIIGEKGVLLSGGQKQKISIVRALLRSSNVIILDEATSAMDGQSEKMVNNILKKISKEKIIISIAHRLSAVLSADRVIIISNGRIVGDDATADIINNDIFKSLYDYRR